MNKESYKLPVALSGGKPQDEEIFRLRRKTENIEARLNLKKKALDFSLNSTVITDVSGKILWVNKAFTDLTGYTFEEVLNKKPNLLKSGIHSEEFYKNLWDTILSGNAWEGEITNKRKDGSIYQERLIISPVLNKNHEITNFIATKQDITTQKEIDSALNESYIKYEELAYIFNQGPAIGFLWSEDDQREVEFVTDNIKQWGYSPTEFYTQKLKYEDIIYHEDKVKILDELSREIKAGSESIKQHYRIITSEGEIRWVDSHLHVRLGENGMVTHLQGVVLDVTERKKAEDESKYQLEQLMHADKMIALGTLVSGVAHEINNPNNFVILNIPLIEKVWFNILPILDDYYDKNGDFNVSDKIRYSKIKDSMPLLFGGITEGAIRIKNIVEDLKSFARKDTSGYDKCVDINKVVQTSVNLTANLVSKSTDNFRVKYSKIDPLVRGNKQKLEQVLINLIENSCQALNSRKQLICIEVKKNNNSISITVSDEGEGMGNEVIRNITDPFFTTKRNKGGTGLGLSIASKIIMHHNGKLDFESSPGNGTRATMTLPTWRTNSND
jgi:PAS domain S-box-containing protein